MSPLLNVRFIYCHIRFHIAYGCQVCALTKFSVWNKIKSAYPDDTTQPGVDESLSPSSHSGVIFHVLVLYSNTKTTLAQNILNLVLALRSLYFEILDKEAKASNNIQFGVSVDRNHAS